MDSTFPLELDLVLGTDMAVTSGCLLTPFCELPSDPWGHVVLSLVVVSVSDQILAHILHFAASKGCPVVKPSVQHSGLPSQQFDQLSNLFKPGEKKKKKTLIRTWIFLYKCVERKCWLLLVKLDYTCPLPVGTSLQGWLISTIPLRLHPEDPWPRHIKANTYPRITLSPQKHPPETNISQPSPR